MCYRLRLLVLLTCLGIAYSPRAWAQETSGPLNTCTAGTCTSVPVVVNGLSPITLTVNVTAGTIVGGEVNCVVHPGAVAKPVKTITGTAATFTESGGGTIFTTNENCYSIVVTQTSCTGCTYTAFYHGIPTRR